MKEQCFYGSVTVGERGQIVIPAEARAEMGIHAGDKLLVVRHPVHKVLMVFRMDAMREFLEEMEQMLKRAEESK